MSSDVPGPSAGEHLADAVATAVLAVPGVSALHGGVLGEVGTYLPGRRVAGVRLGDDRCAVHLVLEQGAGLLETTDAVRAAVRPLVSQPVDVTVEDIATGPSGGR